MCIIRISLHKIERETSSRLASAGPLLGFCTRDYYFKTFVRLTHMKSLCNRSRLRIWRINPGEQGLNVKGFWCCARIKQCLVNAHFPGNIYEDICDVNLDTRKSGLLISGHFSNAWISLLRNTKWLLHFSKKFA